MDYTPTPPPQAPTAPTTYELKEDVTGEAPEKRGARIIVDRNGQQVQLPYAPKTNCKKCHGRGYTGINALTGKFVICHKCYKLNKK